MNSRIARVLLLAVVALLSASRNGQAAGPIVPFEVTLDVALKELQPKWCWFHPRVAAIPGLGNDGKPLVVMTIQKHLVADDHYSGLSYLTTRDLGKTWSEPKLPKELDWQEGPNSETIAVCDVTPGWHAKAGKLIAIGVKLRYSAAGAQLLDQPRSYDFAYAVYDPKADQWQSWKMLDMPRGDDDRFFQLAPGCSQWLVQPDGTLLVPAYYHGPKGGPFSATVIRAAFDGTTLKYLGHGDEIPLNEVRGLSEPSLIAFQGKYYLTVRNDVRGYVSVSEDGQKFAPLTAWKFDDGTELGSYNTQQHWLASADGLFLSYTRRGAMNDHIARNRAPLFLAQVDPKTLTVIRSTEKPLMPERGVMLGNFGAAAITDEESWVTDSEFVFGEKPHPRGADGSTFVARVRWGTPKVAAARSTPTIIAHRGLLKHSPENTLSNFRACGELRLGLEFDVRRSKDGVLVCVHDDTLRRTTNTEGKVSDKTLSELKSLDAGSWFGPAFQREKIPTIDEILAVLEEESKFDGVLGAVDLKDANVEADVVRLAEKRNVLDRLVFIGNAITQPEVRKALRKASAKTHVACLAQTKEDLAAAIADADSDWIYLRFIPTTEDVKVARSANKRVFVSGPKVSGIEDANWRQSVDAGADAILTDFPLELAALIRSGGSAIPQKGNAKMDAAFEALSARFVDEYPALSPVGATSLGDHRYDHLLDDVSAASRQKLRAFLDRYHRELKAIDRSQLSRENQVDYALIDHQLRKELWELETLREWAWNPVSYAQLVGGSVYSLVARDFAPIEKRLPRVADRLEQLPRLFRQIRETLEPAKVPSVHAETAIKQNKGVLSTIDHFVRPHLDKLPDAERKRMLKAIEATTEAVEQHQTWLEKELLPKAKGDFRLGPKLFDQKLEFALTGGMSRAQVRERAEFELNRVRGEMYKVAVAALKKASPGKSFTENPSPEELQKTIEAALELANAEIPPRDGVVPAAEKSLKLATEFIQARGLMTIPTDPIDIIIMPEFQRGVSVAYCDSPGPLEVGQKTFYAVAPCPDDWSDAQCKSFLREYNLRAIHNLTIHEAMPGHFVQIAMANRNPRALRSLLSSGVFVEGWACYTEQMMAEEGFLDADPLMKLVAMKWYLRSIGNAILDQAIHVDGMRREEAMELMTKKTFQEEREAAGKWIRAQLTSSQLSTYFVGLQEHWEMRAAAKKAWGQEFTLKKYHDVAVSFGSPPTRFVRALLLGEPIAN